MRSVLPYLYSSQGDLILFCVCFERSSEGCKCRSVHRRLKVKTEPPTAAARKPPLNNCLLSARSFLIASPSPFP